MNLPDNVTIASLEREILPDGTCPSCQDGIMRPLIWWKYGEPQGYTGDYECDNCFQVEEEKVELTKKGEPVYDIKTKDCTARPKA